MTENLCGRYKVIRSWSNLKVGSIVEIKIFKRKDMEYPVRISIVSSITNDIIPWSTCSERSFSFILPNLVKLSSVGNEEPSQGSGNNDHEGQVYNEYLGEWVWF